MIKVTVTFEMDEEQLRDLFESNDIKFTKKKAKDLQEELDFTEDSVQEQLEEQFEEIVDELIQEIFE